MSALNKQRLMLNTFLAIPFLTFQVLNIGQLPWYMVIVFTLYGQSNLKGTRNTNENMKQYLPPGI